MVSPLAGHIINTHFVFALLAGNPSQRMIDFVGIYICFLSYFTYVNTFLGGLGIL